MEQRITNTTRRLAAASLSACMGTVIGFAVSHIDLSDTVLASRNPRLEQATDDRLASLVLSNNEIKSVQTIVRRYAPKGSLGKKLASLIVRESERAGVDPLFIAAVVKSESTFRNDARSNRNAYGLMQITPITEQEALKKADIAEVESMELSDSQYNLRLGIGYLKQLDRRYQGNTHLALVAYNWGPTRVDLARKGEREIPGESIQYAERILRNHRTWSAEG